MKFLFVRPGPHIVEKTLYGPWEPELSYLEPLYKQAGGLYRFLCMFEMVSPTPLLAIGSLLTQQGEDVEIVDIPLQFGLPLREEGNRKRLEAVQKFFESKDYDVVGLSCTSTFESLATVQFAEAAKKAHPDAKIILGGYQAAAIAEELMQETEAVDAIALSDFEPIAPPFLRALEGEIPFKDVPNIMYRDGGIKQTKFQTMKVDLNEFPYYNFSLVEQYLSTYIMYSVEAGRGCPYHCSYCQERTFRKYYTVKNPERAVDELVEASNYIASVNNMAFFFYSDPMWGLERSWVRDFCTQLIERRDEIRAKHFGWFICTRFGILRDEEFELLKKAGCATIGYGIESLSPKMLKMMGRAQDQEKYIREVHETLQKTLANDLHMYISMILGMPGETPDTLRETIEGLKSLPINNDLLHIFVFLAYPLPKTLLEQQLNDPAFLNEMGIKVWAQPDWRKGYFPKVTPLFDPSRELTVQELAQFYQDLSDGTFDIIVYHKQIEALRGVRDLLSTEAVTPQDYMKWARLLRRLMVSLTG